ncbi:MAG: FliA/WhiG family RNA polymerase sigma factor [Negativicutes bacterium]|nr:FliA/WhiG family RNA polymerase sigma factor [Negativicutes bacterium]
MAAIRTGLSEQEIKKLWQEFTEKHSAAAKEKLVEIYLPLVRWVVGRVAIGLPPHVDRDDLLGCAYVGLLEAMSRFDHNRGLKFETYAVIRIRGAVIDALRAQDWLSPTLRQKARQYEQTLAELEGRLGRAASDSEVAAVMGITTEQLSQMLMQINGCAVVPLDEYLRLESRHAADSDPLRGIAGEEAKAFLAKIIDKLPDKERLVVALYYHEGLTLKEISVIMNLSEARISQLHTKAIFRLRGALSRHKYMFAD